MGANLIHILEKFGLFAFLAIRYNDNEPYDRLPEHAREVRMALIKGLIVEPVDYLSYTGLALSHFERDRDHRFGAIPGGIIMGTM